MATNQNCFKISSSLDLFTRRNMISREEITDTEAPWVGVSLDENKHFALGVPLWVGQQSSQLYCLLN